MFPDYIIENFIEILNKNNHAQAKASELNYNSECDDRFLEDLKILERYGFVKIQKSVNNNPPVLITFEGVYYGREYLDNYDEIYDRVVESIKTNTLDTSMEIKNLLGIHHVIIGAVLIDLEEQGLISNERGLGGLRFKFTDEGSYYFEK